MLELKLRFLLGKIIEYIALANSGFETDTPQLLVPTSFILKNKINMRKLGKP